MKWTDAEVALLRAEYPTSENLPALFQRLSRSRKSVEGKAGLLSLHRKRAKWTCVEVALLRAEYPTCASVAELAKRMGRTALMLRNKACADAIRRNHVTWLKVKQNAARDCWASGNRKERKQNRDKSSACRLPERSPVPDLVGVWR